jgi:mercuric ion transport protein
MPDPVAPSLPFERLHASKAALLTLGGVAAAFGLASCCALPLLFATFGIGTAWIGGVALMVAPHRAVFMIVIVAAACLIGGTVLLWRQQRGTATCGPNGRCMPPAVRALTLVGLLIGFGFLWAGYTYA